MMMSVMEKQRAEMDELREAASKAERSGAGRSRRQAPAAQPAVSRLRCVRERQPASHAAARFFADSSRFSGRLTPRFAVALFATQDPVESRMAPLIKREMDKRYSPTWHVFIGKDFGANVTHENKSFISFILGPLSFLVFKSG